MIYPDISTEEWCRRYNLVIRSHCCPKCGMSQTTSIPWATKNWRGLIAPSHACGEGYRFSIATEIDEQGVTWGQIVEQSRR